jgi:hypothetical protein
MHLCPPWFLAMPSAALLELGLLRDTARSSGCKQPGLPLLLQIAVLARDGHVISLKHSSSCAPRAVHGARHIAVRPLHSDHLSSNVTPGLWTCASSPRAASNRSSSAGRASASPLRRARHRAQALSGRMTCEDPDGNLVEVATYSADPLS